MDNETTSAAMFRHVTPVKLPVMFGDAVGYGTSTVAPPADDAERSSAIIIIVLSVVVLAAIFFTVCGLLVKSQALFISRPISNPHHLSALEQCIS